LTYVTLCVIVTQHMARSDTYPLADLALNGQLGALLTTWRSEGQSLATMRDRLRDDHAITVSVSTVSRWLDRFAPEPAA
jgi:hypothetical protein